MSLNEGRDQYARRGKREEVTEDQAVERGGLALGRAMFNAERGAAALRARRKAAEAAADAAGGTV